MTDGFVHLPYNSSCKFQQLAAGQHLSGQPVRYGPPITYKITPAGSLSSNQLGGPLCWASPLAFYLSGQGYDKQFKERLHKWLCVCVCHDRQKLRDKGDAGMGVYLFM